MEALKELGFKSSFKFAIFTIWQIFYYFATKFFPFPPLRSVLLTLMGATVGKDALIMDVKFINFHRRGMKGLKIGKRCFVGDETLIDLYGSVATDDNVTLAQRVLVLTHTSVGYATHPLQKYFPKKAASVAFGEGCFIGAGSIILPGVKVGEQSFVAAGSVVTKDVPAKSLVGGVPAKMIRKLE